MTRWLLAFVGVVSFAQRNEVRTSFQVRYVASGAVYINGGREDGLAEGFRLTIKRKLPGQAQLEARPIGEVLIVAVAGGSAVCEIKSMTTGIESGDVAFLSTQDEETVRLLRGSKNARKYAQVVSFTEGDPLDEEQREYVPKPPLPEVNRVRGRVSFEYSGILDHSLFGRSTHQEGAVVRADMTRIGGTFWNFTGYWRGRTNSRPGPQQQTLTDLVNRTYHIGLYYNNPRSRYTAGFGRLLIPWANSLNTIDGGYLGRRLGKVTAGLFLGSTPDPTAWDYNPNRQIAGSFVNFDLGSFEALRFSSTTGIAVTRLRWKAERQYGFFENSLLYKRFLSIYQNLEADYLVRGRLGLTQSGPAVSRNFVTLRLQPHRVVAFDLNHNYFRSVPTFDDRLIGLGLLDRLLFQGFSAGVRFELPRGVGLYTNIGQSQRSNDAKAALNQMYGVSWSDILHTRIRSDFRYSKFSSAFATGSYRSLGFIRELNEHLRLEVQGGTQDFFSSLSRQNRARWLMTNVDWFFATHYVMGGGITVYRGQVQDYDQAFFSLGYHF